MQKQIQILEQITLAREVRHYCDGVRISADEFRFLISCAWQITSRETLVAGEQVRTICAAHFE